MRYNAGADVALVPDAAERGTNAVGLWLSAALPFLFGDESFARHRAAAAWQELIVEIYRSPSIALDVDTPPMLARYRSELAQGMVGCCGNGRNTGAKEPGIIRGEAWFFSSRRSVAL
ncbi:hypothetical protein HC891_19825 [Candidatus Gracilibacteria bacterium]|nr:hypothetical protein [Candidatus Gracilibacteria bacterium]